jgi:hypothetical protein
MRPRSYTVPIVALSVVLFGLLAAIAVVVGVRAGARDAAPCVVGTWRVTSHREQVAVESVGTVGITGGDTVRLRLGADGTGTTDYGNATVYSGTLNGHEVQLILTGRSDFRYTAADGRLTVFDATSAPSARVLVDRVQAGQPMQLTNAVGSASYTCTGDRLTQRDGERLTVEYTRES